MLQKNTKSARAAKTRSRILRVATKVFSKQGFHQVDVQAIADLAKVGKGTVYRHFGNKEGLFLATSRNCLEERDKFLEKKLGDPIEFRDRVNRLGIAKVLKQVAICCAEFYVKNPHAIEIMIQERAEFRERVFPTHLVFRAKHGETFTDLLQEFMKQGVLRKADGELAYAAFGDLIFGSCINGCLGGSKSQLIKRVEVAIDLFLKGFAIEDQSS